MARLNSFHTPNDHQAHVEESGLIARSELAKEGSSIFVYAEDSYNRQQKRHEISCASFKLHLIFKLRKGNDRA